MENQESLKERKRERPARFDLLKAKHGGRSPTTTASPASPRGCFFFDFVEEEEEEEEYPEDSLVGYIEAENRRRRRKRLVTERRRERRVEYREAVRRATGTVEEQVVESGARSLWQWHLLVLKLIRMMHGQP